MINDDNSGLTLENSPIYVNKVLKVIIFIYPEYQYYFKNLLIDQPIQLFSVITENTYQLFKKLTRKKYL